MVNQRGSGMLQAMVALAVTGIAAVTISRITAFSNRVTKSSSDRVDLATIQDMARNLTSCEDSVTVDLCKSEFIEVKRKDPSGNLHTWVKATITSPKSDNRIGSFNLRAKCNETATGIVFEYARLSNTGGINSTEANPDHFLTDPLSRQKVYWTPLFNTGEVICAPSEAGEPYQWVQNCETPSRIKLKMDATAGTFVAETITCPEDKGYMINCHLEEYPDGGAGYGNRVCAVELIYDRTKCNGAPSCCKPKFGCDTRPGYSWWLSAACCHTSQNYNPPWRMNDR